MLAYFPRRIWSKLGFGNEDAFSGLIGGPSHTAVVQRGSVALYRRDSSLDLDF